jgi:hypothetical protein
MRERPVVLIFHQHVAKLDFCTIHVLPDDEQLWGSPSPNFSMGDDIPDLDR